MYLSRPPQVLQVERGTQRSEEPVSKSTVNFWGGLPIVMCPIHSWPSFSLVSGMLLVVSLARFWTDEGTVAIGLTSASLNTASRPTLF